MEPPLYLFQKFGGAALWTSSTAFLMQFAETQGFWRCQKNKKPEQLRDGGSFWQKVKGENGGLKKVISGQKLYDLKSGELDSCVEYAPDRQGIIILWVFIATNDRKNSS